MTPAKTPTPVVPTEAEATVVFLRPSWIYGGLQTVIVDGQGNYIGDPLAEQCFIARFAPGSYEFVTWFEGGEGNTDMMKAELRPGRIYYVLLKPSGGYGAYVAIVNLTPEREEWTHLHEWLALPQVIPSADKAKPWFDTHRDELDEHLKAAHETWARFDPEKRALHTIGPDDGFTAPN